jgi:rod shape-determining protein MreB
MFDSFWNLVSHDMGIDLGTANTLVLVKGKGIVIREPSVVAMHRKSKKVIAIGTEAKKMLGRAPGTLEIVRPLADGVISDFDATAAMLSHYIKLVHETPGIIPKIPKPKVVIGIPSGVTEVERRAVQEAALAAGARKAYLIEEPMAAAIGIGLPIDDSSGSIIVDIGGGTTEVAVTSLGGIVVNKSVRVAGDEMDEAVISFLRLKYEIIPSFKKNSGFGEAIFALAPAWMDSFHSPEDEEKYRKLFDETVGKFVRRTDPNTLLKKKIALQLAVNVLVEYFRAGGKILKI